MAPTPSADQPSPSPAASSPKRSLHPQQQLQLSSPRTSHSHGPPSWRGAFPVPICASGLSSLSLNVMLRSVALGEPEHGSPCTFPHTRARACVCTCAGACSHWIWWMSRTGTRVRACGGSPRLRGERKQGERQRSRPCSTFWQRPLQLWPQPASEPRSSSHPLEPTQLLPSLSPQPVPNPHPLLDNYCLSFEALFKCHLLPGASGSP